MPPTPQQCALVKQTWAQCIPIAEQAATLFYGRLFELDPALKPLFKADMTEQGRKLMSMITAAVNGLDDLGALVPVVQDLGRRHVGYGVQAGHYETVGSALLWTLEKGLGASWNTEVKAAWTAVYQTLAEVMIEASAYGTPGDGPVSPRQVAMVQQSWAQVTPIAEQAAALFYDRLFQLDPSLRALFSTDITVQGRKLMTMISTAVNGLTDLPSIVPAVQALGRRHLDYGVKEAHYATVGQALLDTLAKGLGPAWNDELKNAWGAVYTTLSTVMIEAARGGKSSTGFFARLKAKLFS